MRNGHPKKRGYLSADDRIEAQPRETTRANQIVDLRNSERRLRRRPRIPRYCLIAAATFAICLCSAAIWMSFRVVEVKNHLSAVASLASSVEFKKIVKSDPGSLELLVQIQQHARGASDTTNDPIWRASTLLPLLGPNLRAVGEVADAADSLASKAAEPLLDASTLLASAGLSPVDGQIDIAALEKVSPRLNTAAMTLKKAVERLAAIDRRYLVPEIADGLDEFVPQLEKTANAVDLSSRLTSILPSILGANEPRNYLVLVQNNAEIRATGGLPGSLAVVRIENGQIDLRSQATGAELGKFVPRISVDQEQELIYTTRLGAYISDVNLTPDFPTAARTAKAMWETRYNTRIDGVLAIDPVVLAHILAASGPLPLQGPADLPVNSDFPALLSADNVVRILLSEVYTTLDGPGQDLFFASIAKQFFESLVAGKTPPIELLQALVQSSDENRLHAWSDRKAEQDVIASTRLGGAITFGPDAGPGSFGAFFNDGTGAKMDYYVKRQVQLVKDCRQGDYGETTVRVTSTNTADVRASSLLPSYVTGGGQHGIPPGSVQTNIVVYGPPAANVEIAKLNGERTDFAPYRHGNRPVAVLAVGLAPGESKTVEFTFGNVGSDTEPNVLVTPTVQKVSEVVLPTKVATCSASS